MANRVPQVQLSLLELNGPAGSVEGPTPQFVASDLLGSIGSAEDSPWQEPNNIETQEQPTFLELNGPWGSFDGPTLNFFAGRLPGSTAIVVEEYSRQEVTAQLSALQQAIENLLPQALALPEAIRQHFIQPLHYARIAAQHYAEEDVELTTPLPYIPGLKFVPLSPRPQWHEWSRRLTEHLRYKLRSYQWQLLATVAADVSLSVAQVIHAAENNTKFRLRPNEGNEMEIRKVHSDSEGDSDEYY